MKLKNTAKILCALAMGPSGASAEDDKTQIGFRGTKYIPAPGVTQKSDVYKTVGERELGIHLHFPQGWKATDRRPVMLFFFGGGWKGGTTKQFLIQTDYFAGRGIVTARADYRVKKKDGVAPDKCVEDARSAVRWLRSNASRLGIDPEQVISAGGSAGGHLAFCTSIKKGADATTDDASVSCIPQAMVLYNPALFRSDSTGVQQGIGQGQMSVETLRRISPLEHIDKDTPPTFIIFGAKDGLKAGADEYLKLAQKVGVPAKMFTAEGQEHGFFNTEPWMSKTIPLVDSFLVSLGYLEEEK